MSEKLTDTLIAEKIGLSQQQFSRWKKNKYKVYEAIRGYFELKEENEELRKKVKIAENAKKILEVI